MRASLHLIFLANAPCEKRTSQLKQQQQQQQQQQPALSRSRTEVGVKNNNPASKSRGLSFFVSFALFRCSRLRLINNGMGGLNDRMTNDIIPSSGSIHHACTVYKIHACNLTGFLLTAAVLLGGLEALTVFLFPSLIHRSNSHYRH